MQREPGNCQVVIYVDAAKARADSKVRAAAYCCRISPFSHNKAHFKGVYTSGFLPVTRTPSDTELEGILESVLFVERILFGLDIPLSQVDLLIRSDCLYAITAICNNKQDDKLLKTVHKHIKRFASATAKKTDSAHRVFRKVHQTAVNKRTKIQ